LIKLKSLIVDYLVVEYLEQKTLAPTGVADVASLQVAASRLPKFWANPDASKSASLYF